MTSGRTFVPADYASLDLRVFLGRDDLPGGNGLVSHAGFRLGPLLAIVVVTGGVSFVRLSQCDDRDSTGFGGSLLTTVRGTLFMTDVSEETEFASLAVMTRDRVSVFRRSSDRGRVSIVSDDGSTTLSFDSPPEEIGGFLRSIRDIIQSMEVLES